MLRRITASQSSSLAESLDESVDFIALHATKPDRYPFLLQSTASDGRLGRFDILFISSGETLVLPDASSGPDFLNALDAHWERERI